MMTVGLESRPESRSDSARVGQQRSIYTQGCGEKVYRIVILRATKGQVPISRKVSSLTAMPCGRMWVTPHLALEGNLREWGISHAYRKHLDKRHMLIQRTLMSVETQL